jgi:hypothetical protein
MDTGEIAELAHIHLQNLRARSAERHRVLLQLLRKAIHFTSAATSAVAAFAIGVRSHVVILALCLFRMA